MLAQGAAVWGAFWVAGLPNYYQQYSAAALFDTLVTFPPTARLLRERS